MQLKDYQNDAIDELLKKSIKLLGKEGNKKIIFKSPTGSGKTIMMAEYLKQLVNSEEIDTPLAFIWIAPRKLHSQSQGKLEKYFEDNRALECSVFFELTDKKIDEDEILFINWESINKEGKNTIIKENEHEFYLEKVIENTKDEGREIIFIIDESHQAADTEISQKIIESIAPKLTIKASATPDMTGFDDMVPVDLEDVKQEGMIKQSITLNPDFKNIIENSEIISTASESTNEFILRQAIEKRNELKKAYDKEGININPLLLVQIPDRNAKDYDLKDSIEKILRENHNITIENGKLAIYLSEEQINKENIEKHDNESEVMIFKQAIALGWDCPRAQILLLFREWKSMRFSIQTIGRIMRMPLPDIGIFENDILNQGYVYTNLASMEITEDLAKSYIAVRSCTRKPEYEEINLRSVSRKRQREKTRLSPEFEKLFMKEVESIKLSEKIDINAQAIYQNLIADYKTNNIDILKSATIDSDIEAGIENEEDLQRIFSHFIIDNLSSFHPEPRSVGRLRSSIYRFFEVYFQIGYESKQRDIIKIVMSEKNQRQFMNVINTTIQKYQDGLELNSTLIERDWEVPESLSFTSNLDYKELNVKKSIMSPFYYDDKWKTEKAFIDFLEKSDEVKWWFKNGDRDATYFAVPYEENDEERPFYVDFLVMLNNGKLGLFDTKSGQTIKASAEKSDGLQKYIKNNKNLFGGIATNTDQKAHSKRWVYFTGNSKNLNSEKFNNWETIDFSEI